MHVRGPEGLRKRRSVERRLEMCDWIESFDEARKGVKTFDPRWTPPSESVRRAGRRSTAPKSPRARAGDAAADGATEEAGSSKMALVSTTSRVGVDDTTSDDDDDDDDDDDVQGGVVATSSSSSENEVAPVMEPAKRRESSSSSPDGDVRGGGGALASTSSSSSSSSLLGVAWAKRRESSSWVFGAGDEEWLWSAEARGLLPRRFSDFEALRSGPSVLAAKGRRPSSRRVAPSVDLPVSQRAVERGLRQFCMSSARPKTDGGGPAKRRASLADKTRRTWSSLKSFGRRRRRSLLDHASGEDKEAARGLRFQTAPMSVEDFQVLGPLGYGSFSRVVLVRKVRDPDREAIFAMKVVDKTHEAYLEGSIRSERSVLVAMKSKFVVGLCYAFQTTTSLYMLLPYYAGGCLRDHVGPNGVSRERLVFHAAELVAGLGHAHDRGVVHRDVKSTNVLVDAQGHVALADFGLCAPAVWPKGHAPLTTFCGSVEYMAPEVLRGDPYGHAVDWWALGVLLFELATGALPFHAEKSRTVFRNVLHHQPDLDALGGGDKNNDGDLKLSIQCLLAKEASERAGFGPGDAGDVASLPVFRHVDWPSLEARKLDPPYRPQPREPVTPLPPIRWPMRPGRLYDGDGSFAFLSPASPHRAVRPVPDFSFCGTTSPAARRIMMRTI